MEFRPRYVDLGFDDLSKKNKKDEGNVRNFFDNDMSTQFEISNTVSPQGPVSNRRGITWNMVNLENIYRSSHFAQRAIEWNASSLLIKGIDINSDYFTSNEIARLQKTINNKRYASLLKAFKYGYLYGGSGLIKVVKGKTKIEDFAEPFIRDSIKIGDFLGLKPLTRWYQVEPALDKGLVTKVDESQGIYDACEIGLPMYYRINFSGGLSGFSGLNEKKMRENNLFSQGNNILVHRSWLYIFNPYELGHIETQIERHWSKSIIEVAYLDLQRHEIIWTATGKSAVRNNLGILNIKDYDTSIRNSHTNKVINSKLETIKATTVHGIVALGKDDKFVFQESSLSGNEKAIEQSIKQISASFNTPAHYLFNDPKYYDEKHHLQFLSERESVQKSYVYPIMDDLIQIESKNLFGKKIKDYDFEFKSLLNLSPEQKANVMKTMVEMLTEAHGEGLIDTMTGTLALTDILNNPSNVFSHINPKFIDMIKKGTDGGEPITANSLKIELAKALNQFEDKGISGVENPKSSTARINEGGNPKKSSKAIKRHTLNPDKGKV